jgi:hypothetical protein
VSSLGGDIADVPRERAQVTAKPILVVAMVARRR